MHDVAHYMGVAVPCPQFLSSVNHHVVNRKQPPTFAAERVHMEGT